jgi:hypothetical protein
MKMMTTTTAEPLAKCTAHKEVPAERQIGGGGNENISATAAITAATIAAKMTEGGFVVVATSAT